MPTPTPATLLTAATSDTSSTAYDVSAYKSVVLVVSGTWGGAGAVYVTGDSGDGNYGDVSIIKSGARNLVGTITSNGRYEIDTAGTANLLVRAVPTSGNVTVKLLGTREQNTYTAPVHGAVTLTGSAQQLPNVPCKLAILCTYNANSGVINIGASNSIAANSGIELQGAYIATPPLAIDNLNRLWAIGTTSDKLGYLVLL